MTTSTTNAAATTVAATPNLDLDRSRLDGIDYQKIFDAAEQGNIKALVILENYWKTVSDAATKAANGAMQKLRDPKTRNGRRDDNVYIARMREAAALGRSLYSRSNRVLQHAQALREEAEGNVIDPQILAPLCRHEVLRLAYLDGSFTFADRFDLLRGSSSGKCGISNFEFEGNATMQATDDGFLLITKHQQVSLTGEDVHQIIMSHKQGTYGTVPFDQEGVFATKEARANDNGVSFVVEDLTVIDTEGQTIEVGTVRVSMEYKLFRCMSHAVLAGRYPQHEAYGEKYQILNDLLNEIFGDTTHIPTNRFEVEHLHWVFNTFTHKENKVYVQKSLAAIKNAYRVGGALSLRCINVPEDGDYSKGEIFDTEVFKAGILAFERDQAKRIEESKAKREATKQAKQQPARIPVAPANGKRSTMSEQEMTDYLNSQDEY